MFFFGVRMYYWTERKMLFNSCSSILLVVHSEVPVLIKDSDGLYPRVQGVLLRVQRTVYTVLILSVISKSHSTAAAYLESHLFYGYSSTDF